MNDIVLDEGAYDAFNAYIEQGSITVRVFGPDSDTPAYWLTIALSSVEVTDYTTDESLGLIEITEEKQ